MRVHYSVVYLYYDMDLTIVDLVGYVGLNRAQSDDAVI